MEPSNLLQSLALDAWFKVVMYLGLILIVIALTADVRGLTSGEALLFGVGLLVHYFVLRGGSEKIELR